jgi:hypothetical protein
MEPGSECAGVHHLVFSWGYMQIKDVVWYDRRCTALCEHASNASVINVLRIDFGGSRDSIRGYWVECNEDGQIPRKVCRGTTVLGTKRVKSTGAHRNAAVLRAFPGLSAYCAPMHPLRATNQV